MIPTTNNESKEKHVLDADLARAARRGDRRAFVEIVTRYQAMVCGIALGVLGDFASSEDAAQAAFLTAWQKLPDLREPGKLRAWLAQITRNTALGHLRQQRDHEELDDTLVMADEHPRPDETAISNEETALVRELLAKLPETYRLPLVLYYRDGQSVRAVAEALEISEDAVKQRLARGREILRNRMSGLVESILTNTKPDAIFTMSIAAAIGALAAPSAMAAGAFTSASSSTGLPASLFAAMNASKSLLVAAVIAVICIPVGYHVAGREQSQLSQHPGTAEKADLSATTTNTPPTFENSALFAEWRELHRIHGTTAEAMPALYQAIADLKAPFRRSAFRAALIAEWAQLDPSGGLAFFRSKDGSGNQTRQFFEEWLAIDSNNAIDALIASGPGWEEIARETLTEVARRVPSRVGEIASLLPKPENYWSTRVQDAFAMLAGNDLAAARTMAETVTGESREKALSGVAKEWAKSDLDGVIAWAKVLPEGTDRNEIIRSALVGKASIAPAAALELVGIVPSGGENGYTGTSTAERVLAVAAETDFETTAAWVAAHPGRFGKEDMHGLNRMVTERLNADATGFLTSRVADGSFTAIVPAINSALLNNAAEQSAAVWEWLKTQPATADFDLLRKSVLNSAGFKDPSLALRMVADLPVTAEGDSLLKTLANGLLNGSSLLSRFDGLLATAPDRLKQPLIDAALQALRADTLEDPQRWVDRLDRLPEQSRASATAAIARAWAEQTPEDAWNWVLSIGDVAARGQAAAQAVKAAAVRDPAMAQQWIESGPFAPETKAELQTALANGEKPQ